MKKPAYPDLPYVLPPSGFVRMAQLIPSVIPFSATTLWRKVREKEFPQPVKLSARFTAWKVEEVRAWLQSKEAARGEDDSDKELDDGMQQLLAENARVALSRRK